eukprot:1195627-Prorocentrum_minimum.AAC.2
MFGTASTTLRVPLATTRAHLIWSSSVGRRGVALHTRAISHRAIRQTIALPTGPNRSRTELMRVKHFANMPRAPVACRATISLAPPPRCANPEEFISLDSI